VSLLRGCGGLDGMRLRAANGARVSFGFVTPNLLAARLFTVEPQQKWSVRKPETASKPSGAHFSDNLLMRIPQAANRFRLPDRRDLSQPVGFRSETTIHHGDAVFGKHHKVGVRFDQRHRRAAAAQRI
jgi:hypothetical protein